MLTSRGRAAAPHRTLLLLVPLFGAAYCLICLLTLLAHHAAAPPFSQLLAPEILINHARTLVLLHHKRLPELNATLHQLATLPTALELRVIVAQTLSSAESSDFNATAGLLARLSHLPLRLSHSTFRVDPSQAGHGSYSVNTRLYGNKKNSIRNMLHGVRAAFEPTPPESPPSAILVAEDDVALSADTLEFFDLAASLVDATRELPAPSRVELATSFCILRRDNADYRRWWQPSATLLSHRANLYRRAPLHETTFKTFAWLLPQHAYSALREDFESMLRLKDDAVELHASLSGCPYCSNFCYDHYLEWRWRNASVVCPEIPRSRQLLLGKGGGMTERPGVETAAGSEGLQARRRAGTELSTEYVRRWQFVDDAARRRAAQLLDGPCCWMTALLCVIGLSRWCVRRGGSGCGGGQMARDGLGAYIALSQEMPKCPVDRSR